MRRKNAQTDVQVDSFVPRQKTWNDRQPDQLVLGVITGATAIAGGAYRWLYSWEEAVVGPNPNYTPQTKNGLSGFEGIADGAISISELSNVPVPSFYSYGVPSGDLVGTFVPKQIPIGTFVILTPMRTSSGTLIWFILNTQAISGTCP